MIKATPFESFRQHRTDLPAELEADVRVPTLIVEHSDHSDLLWALRLTEFFGDAGRQYSYQPDVQWNDDGCGMLSYADTPVAEAEANASGTCSCRVRSGEAGLTFEIDVTNQSSEIWPEFWGWLCLIHRWSRAFQANCELPVGDSGNWVPASSLAAPLERWLKWCPVSGHAEAMQIGQNQGTRWQPHIQATQGAVRAWRMHGGHQQFVQLSSPNAIILGWSHWPCTDLGVHFGTLEPGQTGRVTGQLEFTQKSYVPI
jgi:hypothetical protein